MAFVVNNSRFGGVLACVALVLRSGLLRTCRSKLILAHSRVCICSVAKTTSTEGELINFSRIRRKYYSEQSKTCWKCDSEVEKYDLFCQRCNAIQKLNPNRNYFDLFGIRERYSVDLKAVRRTFRDLQRLLHPDLFSNKDEEEKKLSEEHSSLVNKAYTVLNHPLRRALYMLQLKGIDIEKTPASLSQEFLIEIMERNEEVDGLEDKDKIQRLSGMYKNIMMELSEDVERAFDAGDLERAKEIVSRMKYFTNLETKLRDLRQKFGILE